ncbi:MAG: hypothetical protein HON90_17690 [Halobacteriovoraceae bacterium]|nr:hypothetical protein [Halobacteriovoraceae bacterium]
MKKLLIGLALLSLTTNLMAGTNQYDSKDCEREFLKLVVYLEDLIDEGDHAEELYQSLKFANRNSTSRAHSDFIRKYAKLPVIKYANQLDSQLGMMNREVGRVYRKAKRSKCYKNMDSVLDDAIK